MTIAHGDQWHMVRERMIEEHHELRRGTTVGTVSSGTTFADAWGDYRDQYSQIYALAGCVATVYDGNADVERYSSGCIRLSATAWQSRRWSVHWFARYVVASAVVHSCLLVCHLLIHVFLRAFVHSHIHYLSDSFESVFYLWSATPAAEEVRWRGFALPPTWRTRTRRRRVRIALPRSRSSSTRGGSGSTTTSRMRRRSNNRRSRMRTCVTAQTDARDVCVDNTVLYMCVRACMRACTLAVRECVHHEHMFDMAFRCPIRALKSQAEAEVALLYRPWVRRDLLPTRRLDSVVFGACIGAWHGYRGTSLLADSTYTQEMRFFGPVRYLNQARFLGSPVRLQRSTPVSSII
eukprot:GHVU01186161.1.p1 GENE.GHVU01186161.1~~GHVU01186161.1.p1  ORF type:complete len:349 (+),score=3.24 GHVU01186161.1:95-1141(+)